MNISITSAYSVSFVNPGFPISYFYKTNKAKYFSIHQGAWSQVSIPYHLWQGKTFAICHEGHFLPRMFTLLLNDKENARKPFNEKDEKKHG